MKIINCKNIAQTYTVVSCSLQVLTIKIKLKTANNLHFIGNAQCKVCRFAFLLINKHLFTFINNIKHGRTCINRLEHQPENDKSVLVKIK